MRIAFVGRGGSGRTTSAAVFARHLAALGRPVVAIDADVNQHLGAALGHAGPAPLAMGSDLPWLKDHLRGTNPLIASSAQMIRTTPPGPGSRMLDLDPTGELLARYAATSPDGVRYVVTGECDEAGHSTTGAVELYLNHLLDGPGEYVVVDMTAGADAFASGLFTRFDLTVLVSEPTRRGVGVFRQYAEHAAGHGVELRVLGNKIDGCADAVWLRQQVGDALVGCVGQSAWVRSAERGPVSRVTDLEPSNLSAFDAVLRELDGCRRDWAGYHRGTVAIHLRSAAAWGNAAAGSDLAAQVDPSFVPGQVAGAVHQ